MSKNHEIFRDINMNSNRETQLKTKYATNKNYILRKISLKFQTLTLHFMQNNILNIPE